MRENSFWNHEIQVKPHPLIPAWHVACTTCKLHVCRATDRKSDMWNVKIGARMRLGHQFQCKLVLDSKTNSKLVWVGPPTWFARRPCYSSLPKCFTHRLFILSMVTLYSLGSKSFSKLTFKEERRNVLTTKLSHCAKVVVIGPCKFIVGGVLCASIEVMSWLALVKSCPVYITSRSICRRVQLVKWMIVLQPIGYTWKSKKDGACGEGRSRAYGWRIMCDTPVLWCLDWPGSPIKIRHRTGCTSTICLEPSQTDRERHKGHASIVGHGWRK